MKYLEVGLPEIHVRPATTREPRRYLAEPQFSSCTVPIVFYPFHSFNYAHSLRGEWAGMWVAPHLF